MCQVLLFAGTTEGYEIADYLERHGISTHVCVATEYGRKGLEESPTRRVSARRLDAEAMEALIRKENISLVVDATHPYAREVTANCRKACERTDAAYLRLLRQTQTQTDAAGTVYVDSVEAAVDYLTGTAGNILVTTGSKELKKFAALPGYQERLYARVLSLASVVEECRNLGLEGRHLICMQGPFSRELNQAMLNQYECRYLVTKETGSQGGFQEKEEAALACGCTLVVIGRPVQEEGLSLSACRDFLAGKFQVQPQRQISLVGIGMGSQDTMTGAAQKAIRGAQLLIGAKRMAEAVARPGQDCWHAYEPEKIRDYLREHPGYERIAIAMSGDTGFYSGARKLTDVLEGDVEVICGISSVAYFMSKIKKAWDDIIITSAHGKACNLVQLIRQNRGVFAILGTGDGVSRLAQKLCACGMGQVRLYVGERLSYPEEKIFSGTAEELTGYEGDALCVVYSENTRFLRQTATHGIADHAFLRGKAPMTKEEIRSVSLSKLGLYRDSVCYDVGAGTGSVSIEMALRAVDGRVYAIEKQEEAVNLLKENKRRFGADNLEIVEGFAPQALEGLKAPTHAFIGGSSGGLKEIVKCLLDKNPQVRVVINCITLETVARALDTLKECGCENQEIVQITAARSRSVGPYHMMTGENPITIISFGKETKEEAGS